MKTEIFMNAINNRFKVRFLYNHNEVLIDPYIVTFNKLGRKVIYGKLNSTNQIKCFEFDKIFNIKTIDKFRFSPIIPIMQTIN